MIKFFKVLFFVLKAMWKTGKVLLFVAILGFFVASHTITAVAAMTSTAISAVAGTTSTVMGRSKKQAADLAASNARLSADLDIEKRRASNLVAENARLRRVDTVSFRGRSMTARDASKEVLESTMRRTSRSTVANVSSIPGESIPFYGIAIVLAATAYELKSACDNMKDLYDLQVAIDPESARPDDRNAVCALQVPTKQEVWSSIKASPQVAWDASVSGLDSISNSVANLEAPDFGGMWGRFADWISAML
ncbi:hypothetical protein [Loktanella salsilacus]|uniref:hypothetical protein n=1 Tax=Loktanella salsilacus TaxID=195913 RepID=UPI0037356AB3